MNRPMGSSVVDSGRHRSSCLDCADSELPDRCPLGNSTMSGLCCGWEKNGFLFAQGHWNGDEGLDPSSPHPSPSLVSTVDGQRSDGWRIIFLEALFFPFFVFFFSVCLVLLFFSLVGLSSGRRSISVLFMYLSCLGRVARGLIPGHKV
jgi:hypothetical protein